MDEQVIINEFNDADSEQQSRLIMAHFGRAIYSSQLLEQQCVNMLAIHELSHKLSFTQQDVNEIFNKYDFSKQTLGAFSKIIHKAYLIKDQEIIELNEVIKLRNHFTHSYFRFNDVLFYSQSGKLRMITDFFRFTVRAKQIDLLLESYLDKYLKKHNLTEDKILAMMQEVKQEWSGKLIDEEYDSKAKNN